MESRMQSAMAYFYQQSDSMSREEALAALEITRQLHDQLAKTVASRPSPSTTSFYLLHEKGHEFEAHVNRCVACQALGPSWGRRMFFFLIHPVSICVSLLIFSAAVMITIASLFIPLPSALMVTGAVLAAVIVVATAFVMNIDTIWRVLHSLEVWFLILQIALTFWVLLPMSFNWDSRSPLFVLWGFAVTVNLHSDACPPVIAEAIRLAWILALPVYPMIAAGLKLDWFVDISRPQIRIGDSSWDVVQLAESRLLIVFFFGLRYLFKFWRPSETLYLKSPLVRDDVKEKFILFREIGVLPLASHVKCWDDGHAPLTFSVRTQSGASKVLPPLSDETLDSERSSDEDGVSGGVDDDVESGGVRQKSASSRSRGGMNSTAPAPKSARPDDERLSVTVSEPRYHV